MKYGLTCKLNSITHLCYLPFGWENSPWLILFSRVFESGLMYECLYRSMEQSVTVTHRKSYFIFKRMMHLVRVPASGRRQRQVGCVQESHSAGSVERNALELCGLIHLQIKQQTVLTDWWEELIIIFIHSLFMIKWTCMFVVINIIVFTLYLITHSMSTIWYLF